MGRSSAQPVLPCGACVLASEGDYSAYSVLAIVYVLRDIDKKKVVAEFMEIEKKTKLDSWNRGGRFIRFLLDKEYVVEMPTLEWHLGSYGDDIST